MLPRTILLAASLILSFGGIAAAHHSNAAYDLDNPKTIEGTVKTVNWTNPHITFVVEPDAKNGEQPASWVFEVSSPGVLTRSGWTKRSLQPGDHAVFRYAPLRDGNPGGFLRAAVDFALEHPDYGPALREWLRERLDKS